jgi:lipopolysaccharide transport system permease protein
MDRSAGAVFLVIPMAYYHVRPGWSLLWAPVFISALMLLTVGVGLILAAANVRFRDIKCVSHS